MEGSWDAPMKSESWAWLTCPSGAPRVCRSSHGCLQANVGTYEGTHRGINPRVPLWVCGMFIWFLIGDRKAVEHSGRFIENKDGS